MDSSDPLEVAPAHRDYDGANADAKDLSDALGFHHPGLRARVLRQGKLVHLSPKEDCENSVPWMDGGEFGVIAPFHIVAKVKENRVTAFLLSHFGSVLRTEILPCSASDYFSGASEVVEAMAAVASGGLRPCGGIQDEEGGFGDGGVLRERMGNRIVIRSEDCSYVAEGDQNGDCKKSTAICSQCDLLQRRGQRLRAGKGPGPRGPKSAQRKRRRLRLPPQEEEEEGGEHIYLKEEQGVGTKDILSRLPKTFVRLQRLEDQDLNSLMGNVVKKKEERKDPSLKFETDFWEGEYEGEEGWEDGGGGWEDFQDYGGKDEEEEWKPEEQDKALEEKEDEQDKEVLQDEKWTPDVGTGSSSSAKVRGRGTGIRGGVAGRGGGPAPKSVKKRRTYADRMRGRGGKRGRRRAAPGSAVQCQLCLKVITDESRLKTHIEFHRQRMEENGEEGLDTPVDCPRCGDQVADRFSLNKHFREAHDPSKGACPHCLTVLPASGLYGHVWRMHLKSINDDIAKVCPTCGKKCASAYKLKIHIAVVHDPEGPESRICDLCGKRFGHEAMLKHHMLHMHGTKTFNCHSCDKTFNNPMSYYKHVKVHSKVRPWLCDVCNYRGVRRDNVLQHIRRVHSMDVEAALAVIRKDGNYEYDNDGRDIDGLKPPANHVCHLCGKTYAHAARLNRHILLSHEQGPRIYQCSTCGKSFSDDRSYFKHLKVHSSVKPWLCTLCGYRSVRRDNTLLHVRKVHGLSTADGQGVITKDGLYSYEDGKKKQPQKNDEDESQAVVSAIIGTTNENNQIEHHGGGGEPCQNPQNPII